ncbi:MAG: 30S ribosome-binding factor RbfA [Candidatus Sungbacteria bacterium]|nr:30S ribosome-binding factor RbfA [Candidatus Sungbacteria bacterium]
MASERRIEQLSILLKEEIAKIVDRELEFPEGGMVTLTRVVVSRDARYATVFFSVLGTEESVVADLFGKNIYRIQQLLNRAVRMRPVPQIRFAPDQEEARREGVEASLAALKREGEI